jgi:hypothetical protein
MLREFNYVITNAILTFEKIKIVVPHIAWFQNAIRVEGST